VLQEGCIHGADDFAALASGRALLLPRLPQPMHTALREAELLSEVANALLPIVTKILANEQTSVPKSHVGLCSEE
jgi:hypothetical protein